MSTALTTFTPMDLDELEKQEKQIGFGGGNSQFFQFQAGRNVIRFLPGLHGAPPFISFFKHFVKGADGGKAWGGPCPNRMAKLPCPVCAVAAQLTRTGSEVDQKLAEELTPKGRVIGNLIDRAAPDAGPQLAEFGSSIYNAVKDVKKALGDDPTHPTEGFDLVIEKSGKGLATEYKTIPKRQASPIHPDAAQMAEWLENAPDLRKYVTVLSEADMVAKLAGTLIGPHLAKRHAKPAQRAQAKAALDTDGDESY